MIPLCNMHSHTVYGDGKNTPEEMALAAIEMGAKTLGISEHSPLSLNGEVCNWALYAEEEEKYFNEMQALKEKYKDKLIVLAGTELDCFSKKPTLKYDYIIGSVHYVHKDGVYVPMDSKASFLRDGADQLFGGDVMALAKEYFSLVANIRNSTGCDIVGHFDVLTKTSETDKVFDEDDRRYRSYALEALDALMEQDSLFEINTGAISRGYRTTPYPSPFILKRIAEKGGRVMITGDSHSTDALFCGYGKALELAASCGIKSCVVYDENGFSEYGI